MKFWESRQSRALPSHGPLFIPLQARSVEQEREGMDKVLNAAAMTYVAAVVSTLMTLLYYLLRASAMSRR